MAEAWRGTFTESDAASEERGGRRTAVAHPGSAPRYERTLGMRCLLDEARLDGLSDPRAVCFAHLWEERQGENLGGSALGMGQVSGLVSEMAKCLLKVQRNRVMNSCLDVLGEQLSTQDIPLRGADYE